MAAKKIFPVSMSEQEIAEFKQLAKVRGVSLGALIRSLLLEELVLVRGEEKDKQQQ
jgi:hypothetical protein